MLEEKIKKLGNKYIQNGIFEGLKFVRVYIPIEWELIGTEDNVEVERDQNTPTVAVFASSDKNIGFSDIIDSILSVIQFNNDKIMKDKLFDELLTKLEEIFSENDLETLKTLTFEFNNKPKRPYNKKEPVVIEDPDKKPTKKEETRDLLVENADLTNSEIDLNNIDLNK